MKTAHQFAKELLSGPDLPIVVQTIESIKEEGEFADFEPAEAFQYQMQDSDEQPIQVMMVSYRSQP